MKTKKQRLTRWLPLGIAAALCLPALSVRGGEQAIAPVPADTPPPEPEPPKFSLSGEFDASDSYVGDGEVRRDGRNTSLDEHNSRAQFVLTPRTGLGFLRLGVEWKRYSFGFDDDAPLPNTLQALHLIVGLDTKFSDSILVRIEAEPGYYGTFFSHVGPGDFNVPFIAGGTYIISDDVQVIAGMSVDLNQKYPVLPGIGIRWKLAPHLLLDAELPAPRLEYKYSRAVTGFIGAQLQEDTFRVGNQFGETHGDARLNRAIVTFSEVRAGGGLDWKVSPSLTITGEGGCQPYREFDFYRADARYRSEGIAPYGAISLHDAF